MYHCMQIRVRSAALFSYRRGDGVKSTFCANRCAALNGHDVYVWKPHRLIFTTHLSNMWTVLLLFDNDARRSIAFHSRCLITPTHRCGLRSSTKTGESVSTARECSASNFTCAIDCHRTSRKTCYRKPTLRRDSSVRIKRPYRGAGQSLANQS